MLGRNWECLKSTLLLPTIYPQVLINFTKLPLQSGLFFTGNRVAVRLDHHRIRGLENGKGHTPTSKLRDFQSRRPPAQPLSPGRSQPLSQLRRCALVYWKGYRRMCKLRYCVVTINNFGANTASDVSQHKKRNGRKLNSWT